MSLFFLLLASHIMQDCIAYINTRLDGRGRFTSYRQEANINRPVTDPFDAPDRPGRIASMASSVPGRD